MVGVGSVGDTRGTPVGRTPTWKGRVKRAIVITAKAVYKVAVVAIVATASVLLYLANPSLFALGFIAGLVLDKTARETSEKVKNICIAQPWVVLLVGAGAFLALPVTVAAGSFVCGAYVSSEIAGMVPENFDPRSRVPSFIRKKWDGIV